LIDRSADLAPLHPGVGEPSKTAATNAINSLLNGLPEALLDRLRLTLVNLKPGDQLDLQRYAFFPLSCLIAMAVLLEDGRMAEGRLVGSESAAVSIGHLPEAGWFWPAETPCASLWVGSKGGSSSAP
jgi:hypothetical protein